MSKRKGSPKIWSKYALEYYDPIKCGSIDGTDTEPHDRAIIRAINSVYKPNKNVVGDPVCTIFIGRLHIKTKEQKLRQEFAKFGEILRCKVIRDIVTGISKSYAFIEFKKSSSARNAIREMQKVYIDNCEIIVEHEHGRTLKGWKPRRLGGGFGGKKNSGQLRFGGRTRPFQKLINVENSSDSVEDCNRKNYRKLK